MGSPVLGEVPDPVVARYGDIAAVGFDLPHDDLHQRGFSRPVRTDDGNPLTISYMEVNIRKENFLAVLLGNVVK